MGVPPIPRGALCRSLVRLLAGPIARRDAARAIRPWDQPGYRVGPAHLQSMTPAPEAFDPAGLDVPPFRWRRESLSRLPPPGRFGLFGGRDLQVMARPMPAEAGAADPLARMVSVATGTGRTLRFGRTPGGAVERRWRASCP